MSAPAAPPPPAAAAAAASPPVSSSAGTAASSAASSFRVSGRVGGAGASAPLAMFSPAPQADLFRALQKDEYMLARWREEWSELSASMLGGGGAARYEAELELLCRAAYYGTTSLCGGATLGEEYCDLMQVAPIRVYDEFRRERSERRAWRRRHAAPRSGDVAPAIEATPATAISVVDASSAAGDASAAAVSSPVPPAVMSTVEHPTAPVPVAAPLFSWARYNRFQVLSPARRVALFFAQVCLPYLYDKLQRNARRLQFDVGPSAAEAAAAREEQERHRRLAAVGMPVLQLDGDDAPVAGPSFSSRVSLQLKLAWNRLVSLLLRSADYTLFNQLQRLHLALFYLTGRYLEVSKRVTGIQYVQLRRLDVARPGYELFGILLLIQVTVTVMRTLRDTVRAVREEAQAEDAAARPLPLLDAPHGLVQGAPVMPGEGSASGLYALSEGERAEELAEQREMHVRDVRPGVAPAAASSSSAMVSGAGSRIHGFSSLPPVADAAAEDSSSDSDSDSESATCTLCLCPREHTTATECGHLFCWSCISECLSNKAECPLCRQPCGLNTLLRLSQYK